jgi:PKD repeat protein
LQPQVLGSIELRVGGVNGTLLATTNVPATGGEGNWAYIESPITAPTGINNLYFVFGGSGSNIFDLDYIEFLGEGVSVDNTPPIIERVTALNGATIAVKFSEYLNEPSAETIANYAIDNGISIVSAELQVDDRTVYLTTSQLSSGISYLLTVQDVENTKGLGINSETFPFSTVDAIRINAGGPEVTTGGETFIADNFNSGGTLFDTTEEIAGTEDDALYQTERFGNGTAFGYEIPVGSSGEYDIRLHFAEIFYGLPGGGSAGGQGSRIFNVTIEGTEVLTNFDILSEVAPATALIKEFNDIMIDDGAVSIEFIGVVENPKINAIEVLDSNAISEPPTNADITITSPLNGWDVNQPFEVAFRVENWTILEGDTHIHYYIDDMMMGPYYSYEPLVIDDLSLGEHTIKIELFNANHTGTGIFDEVRVNITGSITCNTTEFPDQWGVKQLETSSLPHVSVYTFADFDLDGDGLKDIVTGAWWYKNPGSVQGNWIRSEIGNTFNNVAHVHDFDQDGDLDLLGTTGTYQGSDLVWAQNDGSGNFTVFSNIPSGTSTFSEPFLAGIAGGVFEVAGPYQMAINWNGAEATNDPMQLLTPSPDPTTGMWTLETLSLDSTGEDIQAGDIDQDNDLDLFQGSNWLRNDLSTGGGWTTFSTGINYATTEDRAQLADFDRDGDLDAVVGQLSAFTSDPNASEFAWFAAPADPTQLWTKNVLDTDVNGSLSVFATDMDFDGDVDIVVGEWIGDFRLLAFENNLCVDGTFIKRVLNPGIPGQAHHDGARVTDIDNDGDLDVISNGWFDGSGPKNFPRIYENQTVPVADDEPIVDAGPDQNVMPSSATLNGSGSDPDGGSVTYQWSQISGPNTATLTNDTTETLSVDGLVNGVYVFRLTVTDDELDVRFDEAIITVSDQASGEVIVNAGSDRSITLPNNTLTLNGTASDPDGGEISSYEWTQVSGPNTATLTNENTASLMASDLIEGMYVFRLTVIDEDMDTNFDDVMVSVFPEGTMNMAPIAVVEANPTTGVPPLAVTFIGSNSTDDSGSISSYFWDFGDGMTSMEADPQHTYGSAGQYEVVLTVTDEGGLTGTDTITILVGEEMSIKLEFNPPRREDNFARIAVANGPDDLEVMNITIHDVGGRYVSGHAFPNAERTEGDVYLIPISTLQSDLYFIRVNMNQGKPVLLKLLISN